MGVTTKKYGVTPMDFEQKIDFFKIHKNAYMGPLCISNPQYGVRIKKYKVSVSFCPKLAIFGKTVG
jgi:hypothetical protein